MNMQRLGEIKALHEEHENAIAVKMEEIKQLNDEIQARMVCIK
jgi:hypothetical protein